MTSTDVGPVLSVNQAFYEAFEARDLDAMSEVWEHGDRVVCTHPGWSTLRGWGRVAGSWYSLFQSPTHLQFIITDAHVEVVGDVAWVTCEENILGGEMSDTVAALNVFTCRDGRWRMVAHHGTSVVE